MCRVQGAPQSSQQISVLYDGATKRTSLACWAIPEGNYPRYPSVSTLQNTPVNFVVNSCSNRTSSLWLLPRACRKDDLVALCRRLIFDCAADARSRISLVASMLVNCVCSKKNVRERSVQQTNQNKREAAQHTRIETSVKRVLPLSRTNPMPSALSRPRSGKCENREGMCVANNKKGMSAIPLLTQARGHL